MELLTLAPIDGPSAGEMSAFARWFLAAADRRGISATRIAEKAGVSRSYLHKMLNSHKPEYRYYVAPSYDKTRAIGEVLGDTVGAMSAAGRLQEYRERAGERAESESKKLEAIQRLIDGPDDPLSRIGPDVDVRAFSRLPLATGPASAGEALINESETESAQFGDVLHGDVRTIRVEGDCMEPFHRNGDVLFVKRSDVAENGETVVAVLNGETVACKVYRNSSEGAFLEATNGKYPKIVGEFRIVGVVKGSYRP